MEELNKMICKMNESKISGGTQKQPSREQSQEELVFKMKVFLEQEKQQQHDKAVIRLQNQIIRKKDCTHKILERYTDSSFDRKPTRQRVPSDFTERFPLCDPEFNQFDIVDTTKLCSHKHYQVNSSRPKFQFSGKLLSVGNRKKYEAQVKEVDKEFQRMR